LGQGNQYRYILVTDKKKFPRAYIKKLVNEAYANSLAKVKDKKQIICGQTIVKSISDKKRADKKQPARTKKIPKPK
jgi:ABC-type transporter MlaC component